MSPTPGCFSGQLTIASARVASNAVNRALLRRTEVNFHCGDFNNASPAFGLATGNDGERYLQDNPRKRLPEGFQGRGEPDESGSCAGPPAETPRAPINDRAYDLGRGVSEDGNHDYDNETALSCEESFFRLLDT